MDLNKLRTFVTVAREANLTRAADILCLSQPAVSGQLKALEEELGLQLFIRISRGMKLTDVGKALLEHSEQALAAIDQISTQAKSLRDGVAGEFRLGTIASPSILKLETTVKFLTNRHPHLRLSFTQGISGDVIEWILKGQIEAGYVIGHSNNDRLVTHEIAPVTLRIVAPSSWENRIKTLDWKVIATLPWISTPDKCSFNSLANQMFARHQVKPQTIIEADQEHTLRSLVASGMGMTLLREDVALEAQASGEVVLWEPGIEMSHVYFVYLKEKGTSISLQAVRQVIHEIWGL
jgi:DNA-binding transcriptional LysR family regulator